MERCYDEDMGQADRAPDVDERLVMPETRAEIVRGALVMTPPADEPHGRLHFDLAYLLAAHVGPGYQGAVEMLTRTSRDSDFAPDASIYPIERNPETGGRKLEEIAFEIVSEQWIGVPSEKARELTRRGVRRVFCVVRKQRRVLEWSRDTDGWRMCAEETAIEDRALARPLPIRALLDATLVDRAVIAALEARGLLDDVKERAALEARRDTVRDLCAVLGIDLDAERATALATMDARSVEDLIEAVKRDRAWLTR
jgi:Uma2 family endonuclease